MKIGEALSEKKRLQSRLAKCNELLRSSFYYVSKPDFSYKKLRKEIDNILKEIKKLKLSLTKTNMSTKCKVNGKEMSLAELIIEIGDIRSQIASLSNLYKEQDDYYVLREGAIQQKSQVKPEEIENEIKALNQKKTTMDALLQHLNWTVDLKN